MGLILFLGLPGLGFYLVLVALATLHEYRTKGLVKADPDPYPEG